MEALVNMIGAVGTGIGLLAIVLLCMVAVVLSAASELAPLPKVCEACARQLEEE